VSTNSKEYARTWRAANRARANAQSRAWYAANSERAKERSREWYAANSERAKANNNKWLAAHPEYKSINNRHAWRDRVAFTLALLGLFQAMSPKWRRVLAQEIRTEGRTLWGAIEIELEDWLDTYAPVEV
jgi:hypothetical protein